MVKFHHAIVAQVAVARARRPEDIARLAKLELEHEGLVRLMHLKVVYARFMAHFRILIGEVAFDRLPAARRHDPRLSRRRVKHEEVCQGEEYPQGDDRGFPRCRSVPIELGGED